MSSETRIPMASLPKSSNTSATQTSFDDAKAYQEGKDIQKGVCVLVSPIIPKTSPACRFTSKDTQLPTKSYFCFFVSCFLFCFVLFFLYFLCFSIPQLPYPSLDFQYTNPSYPLHMFPKWPFFQKASFSKAQSLTSFS